MNLSPLLGHRPCFILCPVLLFLFSCRIDHVPKWFNGCHVTGISSMDTSGSHKKSKAHFLLGDVRVRAAGKRAGPGANYGGTAHHLRGETRIHWKIISWIWASMRVK